VATAVCKKAEETDANKAMRKHVEKKPPQKLLRGYGHQLLRWRCHIQRFQPSWTSINTGTPGFIYTLNVTVPSALIDIAPEKIDCTRVRTKTRYHRYHLYGVINFVVGQDRHAACYPLTVFASPSLP
jgi:hypothetical protein